MQPKWKAILVNWVNCYFNESEKKEKSVSIESLLLIISCLRENLSLDESKSSVLEANNIQEFLAVKYTDFKFENGTLEPSNEEELYVVASLLLFFVCVNSKNVNIKNAMCSKLCSGDQEIILKFSKYLMTCPVISYQEVLAAISESCGEDLAVTDSGNIPAVSVSETPPALRSLHGEVRRLQASLDAERFDRNYLQEELSRTNLKLKKLVKDKEQSKLEIMSLKGKISLCCGQEKDGKSSSKSQGLDAATLDKQLYETEERLGDLQSQIEDLQYECDNYKSKMEELKQDRDRWQILCQQGVVRAQKLSEELETEKDQNKSLKDLVQELQQHNRLNGLDTSQLECDDPDASIHSFNNISVCSEACANVIEVQLGEERAKIVTLKHQIQTLQEQLNTLTQSSNDQKQHYESILLEREHEVFELKHRINEEIEEKSNMKIYYNESVIKLHNEINELDQALKENVENTRIVTEKKMQEIKTLQEEKLSLLQSLSNETNKMETIIQNLKTELATEISCKTKMMEEYSNKLMKLNEKVLNRNNELVELQNNVFEKSEMIETMRLELKQEKTFQEELCNKHNDEIIELSKQRMEVEEILKNKCDYIETLIDDLNAKNLLVDELSTKIEDTNKVVATLEDDCKILKETKEKLQVEVQNRDTKINQIEIKFHNEKEQLEHNIDERNALINTLQMQLQAEIQFKLGIQNSINELEREKNELTNEVDKLSKNLLKAQKELHDKDKMVHGLDMFLKEEKVLNEKLKRECTRLSEAVVGKERELTKLNNKRKEEVMTWVDKLKHNRDDLSHVKSECESLSKKLKEGNLTIAKLEEKLDEKTSKYEKLEGDFNSETTKLLTKLNDMEREVKDMNKQSKNTIHERDLQIQTLSLQFEEAQSSLRAEIEKVQHLSKEKEALLLKLQDEISFKNTMEKEYQNQCEMIKVVTNQINHELREKSKEISSLQSTVENLQQTTNLITKEHEDTNHQISNILHNSLDKLKNSIKKEEITNEVLQKLVSVDCDRDLSVYNKCDLLINIAETLTTDLTLSKNKEIALEQENSELNTMMQGKDVLLHNLQSQLKELQQTVENAKIELTKQSHTHNTASELKSQEIKRQQKEIEALNAEINDVKGQLDEKVHSLQEKLLDHENLTEKLKKSYECQIENLNLMTAKLTHYLKDKTIELDGLRKENENLMLMVEDNKKVIKSLEEQIKSLNQKQDKILSDFESERLVLKNMVTVTESVMEDQKNSQTKTINDLEEANKQLQSENITLKETMKDQKIIAAEDLELKESIINAALKELTEVKEMKGNLEKEKDVEIEIMDKELKNLVEDLEASREVLSILENENAILKKAIEDNEKAIKLLEEGNIQSIQEEARLCLVIDNLKQSHDDMMTSKKRELEEIIQKEINTKTKMANNILHLNGQLDKILAEKNEIEHLKMNLETQVKAMTAKMNSKDIEEKRYVEKLQEENNMLVKVNEENKSAMKLLEEANAMSIQEEDRLKSQIDNLKISLDDILTSNQKEVGEIIKRQIEEKALMVDKIQNLNEKLGNVMEAKNEIETLKVTLETQVKEITAKLDTKSSELNEEKELVEKLQKENNNFVKVIEENNSAMKVLEEKNTMFIQEAERLQARIENFKQSFIQSFDDMMTSKQRETEEIIEREKEKNTIMVDKLQHLHEQLDKVMGEKNEIQKLKLNMETQVKEMTAEINTKDFEQKEIVGKLQEENNNLVKAIEENKSAIKVLVEEKTNNILEEQRLRSQVEELKKSLDGMITSNQKEMDEKTVMVHKLQHLNNQLEIVTSDKNEIEHLKANLETQLKEMIAEIDIKDLKEKDFVGKLQEENNNLVKVIEEMQSANKILEEENSKINQEEKILRLQVDNLKQSLDDMVTSNQKDMEEIMKSEKEEKTIMVDKIQHLHEQLDKVMDEKHEIAKLKVNMETQVEEMTEKIKTNEFIEKEFIGRLQEENKNFVKVIEESQSAIRILEEEKSKMIQEGQQFQLQVDELKQSLDDKMTSKQKEIEEITKTEFQEKSVMLDKLQHLQEQLDKVMSEKNEIERLKECLETQLNEITAKLDTKDLEEKEYVKKLNQENTNLMKMIEENKSVIANQEQLIKHELGQNKKIREDFNFEKLSLTNQCDLLKEYQIKAERLLLEREKEIAISREEIKTLKNKVDSLESDLNEKDRAVSALCIEKDALISSISKQLVEEKSMSEKLQNELDTKSTILYELRQKLEDNKTDAESLNVLKKENDELIKAIGQRDTFAVTSHGKLSSLKASGQGDKELRDNQVDNTNDNTHSSDNSFRTITDLEKIIHDKNRTITTLQSDITYIKSLMAESENKLLDVTKELNMTTENCQQLASQLKKMVHAKNEEIADLKKQVNRLSVTENRATQIIKVSAKYQAIILKRIAEIKSNTILKELTNFGNSYDNEVKRSLNTGAITMEDLENFLETTDKHLRRCSEKQLSLQKERDRLTEVNRINESEIINLKKFLTELSVSFKTFNSVKELYAQKLSRVVLLQRSVRREILSMEGRLSDAMMCKLERGYAAVMQDLTECAMNLERWVERCISRTISSEKIKQAFTSDLERVSLSSNTFQNASIEVQLDELENSFQKLLEEVVRAQKGGGARDPKEVTVMEVRAEYEDKLNRMKSKMKQLYQEQIAIFKEKQKEDMASLERELLKSRQQLSESSRSYEAHIKELTTELWNVGEKFLLEKDEAEWLRKKQRTGSLMSLQHVHSSGLVGPPQLPPSRPSDTHSLRSLQVHKMQGNKKTERELHMSDEEGEVFDNRWLKSLASPAHGSGGVGGRLSELQWRNSLCPPHLKSSYPAETQFQPTIDEENIKFQAGATSLSGKQRKEVGITAYKKPGPPTPSKQAGRLSATDSELRESLRPDPEQQVSRKTSTPSRLRSLFRSDKRSDTIEGTPRTRRLSNMFRKK